MSANEVEFKRVHSLSRGGIKDRLDSVVISVELRLQKSSTSSAEFLC